MKKKIALLGAVGVAGGLLYALESQHKRNKNHHAEDDLFAFGERWVGHGFAVKTRRRRATGRGRFDGED